MSVLRGFDNEVKPINHNNELKSIYNWFCALQEAICRVFEETERYAYAETQAHEPPGGFQKKRLEKKNPTTGEIVSESHIRLMQGRVFEKVGVNVSCVSGTLSSASCAALSGKRSDLALKSGTPFQASGISLVAHMCSPHVPAVHMNTRWFSTPDCSWFAGVTDLNPSIECKEDTLFFHAELKRVCDRHPAAADYQKFKKNADEYFYMPHRSKMRGVGGVFYDLLVSGNTAADFAFTRDIGESLFFTFVPLIVKHYSRPFSKAQRMEQLVYRGHYAEFNLLYDRGTRFGLETGHATDAIFMALPPLASWP
jgi:coproporphyrinogen III oxidase